MDVQSMQRQLDQALAFAHAAVEDPTSARVEEAQRRAAEVLPQIAAMKPTALGLSEARQLFEQVSQLRAILRVLDRRLERHHHEPLRN